MPPVSFPATVGLDFEWTPSPRVINFQLLQIEEYLANTQVLAEEASIAARVDMQRRFETETDPDGRPWEPLVSPADTQQGILQLTGEMREAAISDEAWIATPTGVFFNTATLPDYWQYHEQPDGGTQRIPQRRFIGIDADTETVIANRADEWLAGAIALGQRGFIRERRTPLGRFAPLV